MTIAVQEDQVVTALRKLDRKRWAEVLTFIGYLQVQSKQPEASVVPDTIHPPLAMASDLLTSELVGLWADRTDIENSSHFARQLRQKAENHRSQRHVTP